MLEQRAYSALFVVLVILLQVVMQIRKRHRRHCVEGLVEREILQNQCLLCAHANLLSDKTTKCPCWASGGVMMTHPPLAALLGHKQVVPSDLVGNDRRRQSES